MIIMIRTICYIITRNTINYFRNKTMGNNNYCQVWKVVGKFNSIGNLVDIWDEGYMCNITEQDKFFNKSEYYGKPVLHEGKDWEEIKELTEPMSYWQ